LKKKAMQICVYCASSAKIHEEYFKATERLGKELVKAQIDVVYGGGGTGLMGQLADTILQEGGNIRGIMPQFMNEVEWGHKGVSDFVYTQTMHERKAKFLEGTDAIIALPGGTGTLEELLEAITLKKLGQISKPIILLNTRGFYDGLIQFLNHCVKEDFMGDGNDDVWAVVNEPEEVIDAIRNAKHIPVDLKNVGYLSK
jgi:uncharacterized protein (TIGR00730 family)